MSSEARKRLLEQERQELAMYIGQLAARTISENVTIDRVHAWIVGFLAEMQRLDIQAIDESRGEGFPVADAVTERHLSTLILLGDAIREAIPTHRAAIDAARRH